MKSEQLKEIAREAEGRLCQLWPWDKKKAQFLILVALERAARVHSGIKPDADARFLGRGKGYLHNRANEPGGEGNSGYDTLKSSLIEPQEEKQTLELKEPVAESVKAQTQKALTRPTAIGWWWIRFLDGPWFLGFVDEVEQEWGGGLRCLSHRMRDNGNPEHAWRGEWVGPIQEPSVGLASLTGSHPLSKDSAPSSLSPPQTEEEKQ